MQMARAVCCSSLEARSLLTGIPVAIPFRKFYVLRLKLTFRAFAPSLILKIAHARAATPSATAFAIRALHSAKTGANDAKAKGRWLLWSFVVAITQKVASSWVPGILYDWHVFNWIAVWGGRSAQYVDNWGWMFEVRYIVTLLTSIFSRRRRADHARFLRRRHPLRPQRLALLLRWIHPRLGHHRSRHGRHRSRRRCRRR
jgi:hypothetical protein